MQMSLDPRIRGRAYLESRLQLGQVRLELCQLMFLPLLLSLLLSQIPQIRLLQRQFVLDLTNID
jgi:hypothetical protein